MMRVLSIIALGLFAFAVAACGGGGSESSSTPTPPTQEVSPTPSSSEGTPEPIPTELRVAYINLGSPITIDENDRVAEETFFDRLNMLVEELRTFQPDIVALSDATWTRDLDAAAWEVLAAGLGLEPRFQRANPWYPGQDREESNATMQLVGFEEGEAILSRYPILGSPKRIPLNPRTSENEGRIALHAVLRIDPYGEVNVYIARLSGSDETRNAQAADLRRHVLATAGGRPTIVLTDMGMPPESSGVIRFTSSGFIDLAETVGNPGELYTCCRPTMLFNDPEPEGTEDGDDTPLPPTPDSGDDNGDEGPGDNGGEDEPPLDEELATWRSLYAFSDSWIARRVEVFAHQPKERPDGSRLYASDQNGLLIVISLEEPAAPNTAGQ
jgi:hypothetical protein